MFKEDPYEKPTMEENECSLLKKTVEKCKKIISSMEENCNNQTGGFIFYREEVRQIVGQMQLHSSPSYTLVLEDKGFSVKCVLKDPLNNIVNVIKSFGKMVVIEKGHITVEQFTSGNNTNKTFVNLVIYGHDIKPVEDQSVTVSHTILESNWKQRFCVQHVSTTIFVGEVKPLCFILVRLLTEDKVKKAKELWLVLKGDQVSWRDLLFPNREYLLIMPSSVPKDYFHRKLKQISEFEKGKVNEALNEILHHPELFSTLSAVKVPKNSFLYLQSNSSFSSRLPAPEPFLWQSLTEVESSNERFLSFYGKIKSVEYETPLILSGCSLCKTSRHVAKNTNILSSKPQKWENPWTTSLTLSDEELDLGVQLPQPKPSNNFLFQDYTPDNLTLKVVLEDTDSGDMVTLYIKNWFNLIRPMALCPGIVLVAKFVNRRYSQKGNLYFVSCALSSFQILFDTMDNSEDMNVSSWNVYGFPHILSDVWKKSWGILDMECLMKVSINATCKTCSSKYVSGHCILSHCKSDSGFTTTASANIQVHSLHGTVNVLLKNDHVRVYLGIDENMWSKLCEASSQQEILYLYKNEVAALECYSHGQYNLQSVFTHYCKYLRRRERFYISVRRLRKDADFAYSYYCTDLEPLKNKVMSQLSLNLTQELSKQR